MANVPDLLFFAGALLAFWVLLARVEVSHWRNADRDAVEALAADHCPSCSGVFGQAEATVAANEFRAALYSPPKASLRDALTSFWRFDFTPGYPAPPIWLVACPHCRLRFHYITSAPAGEAFVGPLSPEAEQAWREKMGLPGAY